MPPRKQRLDNDPAKNVAATAPEDQGPEAVVTKVHVVDDDHVSRKLLQRLVEAGGGGAPRFMNRRRVFSPHCTPTGRDACC